MADNEHDTGPTMGIMGGHLVSMNFYLYRATEKRQRRNAYYLIFLASTSEKISSGVLVKRNQHRVSLISNFVTPSSSTSNCCRSMETLDSKVRIFRRILGWKRTGDCAVSAELVVRRRINFIVEILLQEEAGQVGKGPERILSIERRGRGTGRGRGLSATKSAQAKVVNH